MTVDYELDGHVAVITINRPDARNAVSTAVAQGIEAAIDQLESDDDAPTRATSSAPAPTSSR